MISHSTAVIGWLNKQINEQMMGGVRGPVPSSSLPLSTIRHSSPLTFSSSSAPPHTHHLVGSVLCAVHITLYCSYLSLLSTIYMYVYNVQYAPNSSHYSGVVWSDHSTVFAHYGLATVLLLPTMYNLNVCACYTNH